MAAKTLPQGFAGECTIPRSRRSAPKARPLILGFAFLFAFLFLVALYEWIIPVPVLLSVSVGVLGAFAAILLGGLTLDLYAQIGMFSLGWRRRTQS